MFNHCNYFKVITGLNNYSDCVKEGNDCILVDHVNNYGHCLIDLSFVSSFCSMYVASIQDGEDRVQSTIRSADHVGLPHRSRV